jgi:hypothetical protein
MKYTQTVDNIVNSIAHVLTNATQAYLQYAVQSGHVPEPTSQEEVDKLGKQFLAELALAAVTKATFNPEGVLYNEELAPFIEDLTDDFHNYMEIYISGSVSNIVSKRPEGTPEPTVPNKVEDEDPIVKAKQGRSKIIIPGVND